MKLEFGSNREFIKKLLSIILLVVLVILLDIWLVGSGVVAQEALTQNDVMMGKEAADLSVAGAMFKNPFYGLYVIIVFGYFTKWFMVSIVVDVLVVALIYVGMTNGKDTKEMNGKKINFSTDDGTYGTACWMSINELNSKKVGKAISLSKNTKRNDNIVLGRSVDDKSKLVGLPMGRKTTLNHNIAIYGSPGSGKSRKFVRHNTINLSRSGESMIFTDPKGELFRSLAPYLESQGYEVKCLNLVNMLYSDRWNPLSEVKDDLTAQTFAQVIMENTSGKDDGGKDDFWTRTEANLLKALALYVITEIPPEDANMKTLYSLVASRDVKKTENIFKQLSDNHPAMPAYNIYNQASENVRASAVSGLGTRLQVFQAKVVQDLTAVSDINTTLPAVQKCAYFCIISDMDSTFDFLSGLFFSFLFINLIKYADNSKGGVCPVGVNLMLDEFPNIAKIPDFTKKISTARSRNINCFVIFQSIPQLQNRYPDGQWSEILGSCDTNFFLGANDMETAKYISDLLGASTVIDTAINMPQGLAALFDFGRKTTRKIDRMLLEPNEVLNYDDSQGIVKFKGQNPIKILKYDISEHPSAKKLVEIAIKDNKKEWSSKYVEAEEAALKKQYEDLGISDIDIDDEEMEGVAPDIKAAILDIKDNIYLKVTGLLSSSLKSNVIGDEYIDNNLEDTITDSAVIDEIIAAANAVDSSNDVEDEEPEVTFADIMSMKNSNIAEDANPDNIDKEALASKLETSDENHAESDNAEKADADNQGQELEESEQSVDEHEEKEDLESKKEPASNNASKNAVHDDIFD